MEISKEPNRSHLYMLRLWSEDESNHQAAWSARIQHVFSGETHTFQACPQIVDVLLKLSGREDEGHADQAHGR